MVTRPPGTAPDPCPVDPLNDSDWACRDTAHCVIPCRLPVEPPRPLQAQVEAARFASTRATVDEIRTTAVGEAVHHLTAGDPAAALAVMLLALKAQAPLSFTLPATMA